MKRIAVFCDGTWNRRDERLLKEEGKLKTNVALLFEAFLQTHKVSASADGHELIPISGAPSTDVPQIALYIDGVGTPDKRGFGHSLRARLDKAGGGALGWGLDRKILEAYQFLIDTYEPGDDVFLFGFSRGAYTARSLVGLIRNCGLPSREALGKHPTLLSHFMAIYRDRGPDKRPDADRVARLRNWVNPQIMTTEADRPYRTNPDACTFFKIAYLGVFDTVSALGLPEITARADGTRNKYAFHDLRLSSIVETARHAVAIDEARITYRSQPWDQDSVDWLNARPNPRVPMPVQQEWFPGVHGTVGGSMAGAARGISNATMDWMVTGAEQLGAQFQTDQLAASRGPVDPCGPFLMPGTQFGFVDRMTMAVRPYARLAPPSVEMVSDLARARWKLSRVQEDCPVYTPAPLRYLARVNKWEPPYRDG